VPLNTPLFLYVRAEGNAVGLHGVIAAAPTRNLLLALFSTRQRIARSLLVALFEHIIFTMTKGPTAVFIARCVWESSRLRSAA
jgi:hypothetical protein